MCNVDINFPTVGLKKWKEIPNYSAFAKLWKMLKIERNDIGDMVELSIEVDDLCGNEVCKFSQQSSWDKRKKLLFPVW